MSKSVHNHFGGYKLLEPVLVDIKRRCECGCGMPLMGNKRFAAGHNRKIKAKTTKRARRLWLEERERQAQ